MCEYVCLVFVCAGVCNTNMFGKMVVSVVRNMCVCVCVCVCVYMYSPSRKKEQNVNKSNLHIYLCVCVYVRVKTKKSISEDVSTHWLHVCVLYVWATLKSMRS